MKNTLLTLLLFSLSLTALAQQRPGGGPDDADEEGKVVKSFLETVKTNAKKCGLEAKPKTIVDFQVIYNVHYSQQRSSAQCDENDIPAKFKCILDEKAKGELTEMLADGSAHELSPLYRYYKANNIDPLTSSTNLTFLRKLFDRLNKE